jgi:nitrite reductase (NO-forming)
VGKKGGAAVINAAPGASASFTFVAANPGIYIYHCVGEGTPYGIAEHMNNGMVGIILVEPRGGGIWNTVHRNAKEFYVFEQDIFMDSETHFAEDAMLANESPTYTIYNGRVGSLVDHPLVAEAGRNVIIYHGAAGMRHPSFHVIGEIFDWVWDHGDLTANPLQNVQTVLIPNASAIAVGFNGKYLVPTDLPAGDVNILVDHASPAFRKGALGLMLVTP